MRSVKPLLKTIVDFYRDGFGLLGALAPFISISGAILKFYGIAPMSGLPWAWLLAPLTVWVFAAWVRRRNAYRNLIEQQQPSLIVELALPTNSPTGPQYEQNTVPIVIKIENSSTASIDDIEVYMSRIQHASGSFKPINSALPVFYINPKDHKFVDIGIMTRKEPVPKWDELRILGAIEEITNGMVLQFRISSAKTLAKEYEILFEGIISKNGQEFTTYRVRGCN